MKLLLFFIGLNIVNVVLQTFRSLVTLKCGKWAAAFGNALAYGVYTVVLVYMVCELPLWQKVIVVALCNLIGVFIVKLAEEKMRKDRLWKIEFTVNEMDTPGADLLLDQESIPHNYIKIGKHTIFNAYCATQKESHIVKDIIKEYDGKYFASEAKIL